MSHAKPQRRPVAILIAGPTASGKSALAIRLARRVGGRIINADSMQVYRDLHILTARPDDAELAEAPHALYGTIDGAQNHSVSLWLSDAKRTLENTEADGLVPIFVGGTGLYFKALTQGLSAIPPVPAEVRASVRAWAKGKDPYLLHAELARRDPATAARLRPSDPQRLQRAIEVFEATGEALSSFHQRREKPLLTISDCTAIQVEAPRDVLRVRIDRRFDAMIARGALDEVRRLASRGLSPALPVMRAIGVPPLLRHLDGALSMDNAIMEAKTASRQYLKRQETFLRHQLADFQAVSADMAEAEIVENAQS